MPVTLLVISDPTAYYLKLLDSLPPETNVIVSNDAARLRDAAPNADVLLNAEFRDPALLLATFPHTRKLQWVHSVSAGVEHILSPEIVASPVPLTNGRGVFKRPLGEWAVATMLHFAYDLRRMLRSQARGEWDVFDTDELYGKTLGIVGFGEIGRAAAERAKPFGMRILALRRRPELSSNDPLVDRSYAPAELRTMLAECDYVIAAAPITAETHGLIGAREIAAMKPTAVIVNVGRGPVINEAALVDALVAKRIRGAGLDVFEVEPLPAGHRFYKLDNVLLSAHTADHTAGWREAAIQCFLDNFERFHKGEPLQNLVDKHAGY
jgi:phosphoglycerate dehydrogenase-like enzyme